jgi:streptogramin lyase
MPEILVAIMSPTGERIYMPGYPAEAKNLPGQKIYDRGMAYDVGVATNGNIYATDGSANQIVVFDYEGNVLTTFEFAMVNGTLIHYQNLASLAFNSKGEVFVSESLPCVVVCVDAKGNYLRHFGKPGNTVGSFQRLAGIAIDDLDRVYCSDFVVGSVQVFDDQGNFLHVLTDKGGEQWKVGNIGVLGVDPKKIYLAEQMTDKLSVRKFVK